MVEDTWCRKPAAAVQASRIILARVPEHHAHDHEAMAHGLPLKKRHEALGSRLKFVNK